MKKQIMELLKGNDTIKVNAITRLEHVAIDAAGNKGDWLRVWIDAPFGAVSYYSGEIESRDYSGIIAEIGDHFQKFAAQWAEEVARHMRGGKF